MRSRRRAIRSIMATAAIGAVCLGVAGCGGSSQKAQANGNGKVTVNVGIIPLTSTSALMLGVKKGFFDQENLKVVTHQAQSGAALVPAVASGQYQFAFSNNLSLILAYSKGLPVRIVRSANTAGSDPSPTEESLVVSKSSGITSPKQLAGKTIALDSLNNTPQIAVMTTLKKAGVDPKSVKFVELGYPDMPQALKQGRVAAADISEPTLTVAKQQGLVSIANPYRDLAEGLPLSSWFTTQKFIDSNSDVVKRFDAAVDKSNNYAQKHPDEVRSVAASTFKVDPKLAKAEALPEFPAGTPPLNILKKLANAAVEFGIMPKAPTNLAGIIASSG